MATAVVHHINLFPLVIPLRQKVKHAACRHGIAGPVVVSLELTKGIVGYGETLPATDVTGETVDSVVEAVRTVFGPYLMTFHPTSFPEALEAIEGLPWHDGKNRPVPAARAAVELALLDASMRIFHRGMDDVVLWMGLPGFGTPGSIMHVRFSGVLTDEGPTSMLRQLRLMYWYGLRAFNLKVGLDGDRARFEQAASYLKRPIAQGRATLRLDAKGRWSKDEAIEWLNHVIDLPIAALEQPLGRGHEAQLPVLRDHFPIPLVHDESLVTVEDGRRLIDLGVADGFNIRISKCGGLIPSLRLAALARRANVCIQLGCMIGETSILSAAGLRFLQVCPAVVCAEGCFGSFLVRDDVVPRSLRFGYGGRPPRLRGSGVGVEVDPRRLRLLCEDQSVRINL